METNNLQLSHQLTYISIKWALGQMRIEIQDDRCETHTLNQIALGNIIRQIFTLPLIRSSNCHVPSKPQQEDES